MRGIIRSSTFPWPAVVQFSGPQRNRDCSRTKSICDTRRVVLFCVTMLDSDRQSRMGDARDRLSNSVRGWLAQFGSVTHLLLYVTIAVFIAQVLCEFANWPVIRDIFAFSPPTFWRRFVWQPANYMDLNA